ncbi:EMCN isoform 5 [Pongo abelii]|uniref:EMCN isoform 5 n=1 Tax=Pongo abelii TaxID=9601 RepID=A0A2J8TQE0_PONAB|nr:EMCN isoform 5 [Pongo abelii]
MELLQVTILFLLPSICSSNSTGVLEAANNSLVVTTIKTSITTPNTESLQKNVITPTTGTTPKGKITNELLKMSLMSAVTLTSKDEGLKVTTTDVRKNESIVSNVTVTIVTLPNAVSTLQSSKPKTETQSSIKTTEIPGTPENGNDQPQSDKESVKLLTVKTISHESGEHSAQGKTKN